MRLKSGLFTTNLVVQKAVFESKLVAEKISRFEMPIFGFGHPYNLFKYFRNKGIDSNNTL